MRQPPSGVAISRILRTRSPCGSPTITSSSPKWNTSSAGATALTATVPCCGSTVPWKGWNSVPYTVRDMLVRRNSVAGQSMGIAVFKWIGTVAPTILFYHISGSNLVLALGVCIFVFDLIYIAMLYQKFRELGLQPFTRAPAL